MKPGFLAPKGTLDKKPAHGAPCNRCGLCCIASLCPVARALFKRDAHPGPCPALQKAGGDGTYACGVVASPGRYVSIERYAMYGREALSAAAALLIGSGTGCDARFNGEPADESFYAKLCEWDRVNERRVRQAQEKWGFR